MRLNPLIFLQLLPNYFFFISNPFHLGGCNFTACRYRDDLLQEITSAGLQDLLCGKYHCCLDNLALIHLVLQVHRSTGMLCRTVYCRVMQSNVGIVLAAPAVINLSRLCCCSLYAFSTKLQFKALRGVYFLWYFLPSACLVVLTCGDMVVRFFYARLYKTCTLTQVQHVLGSELKIRLPIFIAGS